ncbi:MAG: sugar ABC transporter permease [Nitrososphaerota archaeon]|nr:sugar ABC transporter permease [Nitrososphaerota archaeon]
MQTVARNKVRSQKVGYIYSLPVVILLIGLLIYPMLYGIYMSFFNTNLVNRWDFVGFQYYIDAFQEPRFYHSLYLTFIFMILVVAGHFLLGFLLASLLNREFKGRTFFRVVFMLPWFFPEAVVALLFSWIMNPMFGLLNYALRNLGIIQENISWLGSREFAFPSIVFVSIWNGFPLVMTMILAGLQSIPKDYYEAARIDGASRRKQFFHITLPSLKPIISTVLILNSVWWFRQYTMVFAMTAGGPGTATNLISLSVFGTAFNDFRFGQAAAWGVLVFIICIGISIIYKAVLKDDDK